MWLDIIFIYEYAKFYVPKYNVYMPILNPMWINIMYIYAYSKFCDKYIFHIYFYTYFYIHMLNIAYFLYTVHTQSF